MILAKSVPYRLDLALPLEAVYYLQDWIKFIVTVEICGAAGHCRR